MKVRRLVVTTLMLVLVSCTANKPASDTKRVSQEATATTAAETPSSKTKAVSSQGEATAGVEKSGLASEIIKNVKKELEAPAKRFGPPSKLAPSDATVEKSGLAWKIIKKGSGNKHPTVESLV